MRDKPSDGDNGDTSHERQSRHEAPSQQRQQQRPQEGLTSSLSQQEGRFAHQHGSEQQHLRRPQMHPIATSGFSFSPLMPQLSFESTRRAATRPRDQPSSSSTLSAPSQHPSYSPSSTPAPQQPSQRAVIGTPRTSGRVRRADQAQAGDEASKDDDEEDDYDSATSDEGEGVEEFDPTSWSPPSPRRQEYAEQQRQPQRQKNKKEPQQTQQASKPKSTRRREHARDTTPRAARRNESASSAKKPRTTNHDGRKYKDDEEFARGLRKEKGWEIVSMRGDGACLFRSVAYHLYGDPEYHEDVRAQCIHYMRRERDHFRDFVPGDFEAYLQHKAKSTTDGNHLEIQAMSELYNRTIEVYEYNTDPINIFQSSRPRDHPIRLSYHNNNHYNAIIDPLHHTFGVGLGLPGLEKPKRVEDDVVEKIKHESMAAETEQQLLAHAKQTSQHEYEKQAQEWEHPPHHMSMHTVRTAQEHGATSSRPSSRCTTTTTAAAASSSSSSSAVHRHNGDPTPRKVTPSTAHRTGDDEEDDALLQLALAQSLQEK